MEGYQRTYRSLNRPPMLNQTILFIMNCINNNNNNNNNNDFRALKISQGKVGTLNV